MKMVPYSRIESTLDRSVSFGLAPELLSIIFQNLDYPDLLRAQRVCKKWQSCIVDVENMQASLYKKPEAITESLSDNPHFEDLTAESRVVSTPGQPRILKALVANHENYFNSWSSPPRTLEEEVTRFDSYMHEISSHSRDIFRTFGSPYSQGALSIWPPELIDGFCTACHGFHPKFHWEHLHPLLRFITNSSFCCISGFGFSLRLSINMYEPAGVHPLSCYVSSITIRGFHPSSEYTSIWRRYHSRRNPSHSTCCPRRADCH